MKNDVIFALIVTSLLLVDIAYGQGARGGSGGSRGGSSSYRGGTRSGSRGGGCSGSHCRIIGIVVGSVIGGIFLIVAVVILIICCCRYRRRKNNSSQSFLEQQSLKTDTKNYENYTEEVLKSGTWGSRYQQYGSWHGPFQMSLDFDRFSTKITGSGSDDVGQFTIDGQYSKTNQAISMTKTYRAGTGNPRENFGHQVTMNLKWNPAANQFEGNWSVNTNHYRGNGKMELKYNGPNNIYSEKRLD